jgi:hypothetical protein
LTDPLHLSRYSDETVYLLSSGLYQHRPSVSYTGCHLLPPDAPLQPLVEWAHFKAAQSELKSAQGAAVDVFISAAAKPAAECAVTPKMQIFVRSPCGKSVTIQADYHMTVLEFKQAVQQRLGGETAYGLPLLLPLLAQPRSRSLVGTERFRWASAQQHLQVGTTAAALTLCV